jgi:hypothetical protein
MVSIDDMPALFVSFDSKLESKNGALLAISFSSSLVRVGGGKCLDEKVFFGMLLITFSRVGTLLPETSPRWLLNSPKRQQGTENFPAEF